MELLQTVFGFLFALFVLVSVHEFGHFIVARLCGVKVLRFCIGMGKPFWSFKDKHGTDFGLAPFPLGGYVKMLDEREVEVAPEERHLTYNSKTVWQRIAILAAGPVANFLLAVLIFWGILFAGGTTGIAPNVGAVADESIAEAAGLRPGHEIVAVDGVPTPTRQAVMEQLFSRLGESGTLNLSVLEPESGATRELQVPLNDWLAGAKDPDPIAGLGAEFYRPAIVFGEVTADGAAAAGGLRSGDVLVSVGGQKFASLQSWVDHVQAHPGEPLRFEVERDGEQVELSLTPTPTATSDGASAGRLGVHVGYGPFDAEMLRRQEFGIADALVGGVEKTVSTTGFVLVSMQKLIVGEISTKNLSGPIGIAKVAGDHARAGVIYFIEFLAILSIYLGVLNLLPIPILDGGHILYCLIEAVKGSPVSERIQMMGFSLGLSLLAGVMVIAFYNDILRL